uniref:Uncharacterized protein n=1 Tax=Anguilla anguilla TaxID=7936 RepID=A0A0E9PFV8_ANGAN
MLKIFMYLLNWNPINFSNMQR